MAQICIKYEPADRDDATVKVPCGAVYIVFQRGVPRMVPQELGEDLLRVSSELYQPATMPAAPAQAAPAAATNQE